jgi:hypothetical protein
MAKFQWFLQMHQIFILTCCKATGAYLSGLGEIFHAADAFFSCSPPQLMRNGIPRREVLCILRSETALAKKI